MMVDDDDTPRPGYSYTLVYINSFSQLGDDI